MEANATLSEVGNACKSHKELNRNEVVDALRRCALYQLKAPPVDLKTAFENLSTARNGDKKAIALVQILNHYCEKPSFQPKTAR